LASLHRSCCFPEMDHRGVTRGTFLRWARSILKVEEQSL
jgi:hypothetical protein